MTLFTDEATPGHPYWWDDVVWPSLEGPLPARVDVLIIGAGYTGLSAAITAHDEGAKVAVIDAGQPGQGASSRNGGMVGAHPRIGWEALARAFDATTADALFAEAATVLSWFRSFVAREEIECDLQQTGRIQLAFTKSQFASQKILAGHVIQKGPVDCRVVERADLGKEIRTPLYHGGILFREHCAVHPARYFHGMLDAVLRRKIGVLANCAATGLRRASGYHEVETTKGTVRADRIILATNGYTNRPFHWFARRVFPLPSYLIATEPLSPTLIAKLAPGQRMMVETRARHSYFRISPDGTRILFGGRASIVDVDLEIAAKRLHATMTDIWPELADVRLSHVWTGNTGYSFDHIPNIGEQNGIHYAMGYSGSGTALAPYLGAKVALRALGLPGGDTAYAAARLASRWFHPGGPPRFLHLADLWYRYWVDKRETRRGRKS